MVEDAECWFNLWIVRRNEKKANCGLREEMRRRKGIVDGRGCRVVVQLVGC
jgi:hypothetical protein